MEYISNAKTQAISVLLAGQIVSGGLVDSCKVNKTCEANLQALYKSTGLVLPTLATCTLQQSCIVLMAMWTI